MTVVYYCSSRRQDLRAIQPFIADCLEQVAQDHHPQIASLSFVVPTVDPLMALAHLADRQEPHLYLERAVSEEAVAAFGSTLTYQSTGAQRFVDAHAFLDQWWPRIHAYQDADPAPDSLTAALEPRFFCSFTFFPDSTGAGLDFPSATITLPQWQILRQGQTCLFTANFLLTAETTLMSVLDELDAHLLALQRLADDSLSTEVIPAGTSFHNFFLRRSSALAKSHFKESVRRALGHITHHQVQKIVLAHALDVVQDRPFKTSLSLAQLRQRYPDCYVFSVGNGRDKTFIGASPERLLSVAHRRLSTDALAGSAPRGRTAKEDRQLALHLLHSTKEQAEHQIVVNFLAQTLAELGLQPYYPKPPTLLRLSNIQHLHTPIQARVAGRIHPLQLVEALHPTPAVAGLPIGAACEQIHAYEQFDRGLYGAPLGWIRANGDSEFIVGIRSALISGNWARLYAGAGIVAGSDPEREWAEINLKFRALGESLM